MTMRITSRRALRLTFLLISGALTLTAQTAPPTPKPSPDAVAGIPVNYDEAKVGTYSLPDPLRLKNGKPVRDAKTWYGMVSSDWAIYLEFLKKTFHMSSED